MVCRSMAFFMIGTIGTKKHNTMKSVTNTFTIINLTMEGMVTVTLKIIPMITQATTLMGTAITVIPTNTIITATPMDIAITVTRKTTNTNTSDCSVKNCQGGQFLDSQLQP